MAIQNYDHCLRFQVVDKIITPLDTKALEVVADNFDNICVKVVFDDQWVGVGKTARFIYNGEWKDVPLDADDECICPSEVLKKGRFYVGVYGAELKTSTPIAVTVLASILSDSGEELPDDPTPGVYDQIMTIMAATSEAADDATKAAWDAVNAASEAAEALNDAKQELEKGGFITGIKEKHKGLILGFWVGSTEEYEALGDKPKDCYVILTDDKTVQVLRDRMTLIETDQAENKAQMHNQQLWMDTRKENQGATLLSVGDRTLTGQKIVDLALYSIIRLKNSSFSMLCDVVTDIEKGSFTISGSVTYPVGTKGSVYVASLVAKGSYMMANAGGLASYDGTVESVDFRCHLISIDGTNSYVEDKWESFATMAVITGVVESGLGAV